MKIAYVSVDPGIPVFGTKGASVHVQEVVRVFRAAGHTVEVFATRIGDEVPGDLADLAVHHTKVGKGADPAARERAQAQASDAIAEQVIAYGPDLVYERYSLFSTVLADVTAATAARGVLEVNAPLVEEQARHRDLVDADAAWSALRAQVAAAAVSICVSDPVRAWVLEHTDGGNVHTVANGVSTTRIQPAPEAPGDPVVTFVGTLKAWHGVDVLVDALARAEQPWALRVLGDGPQRASLEQQAADLGVRVDFRGAVPPAAMPAALAGSAIGVAPYPVMDSEADQYFSPLKIYEYLAAGLPVVASAVGQVPGIVRDGVTGVLVAPSDAAALAAALDALAADPDARARLGAAARRDAEEHHSWAGVVERTLALAGIERAGTEGA
ncbi:MAG: glycosyltransferase family 4 protein [Propionibacteriaceae bacterium]|nr:glycosyltransferase family 4 protein [Propionibacteriaceae bacterium]